MTRMFRLLKRIFQLTFTIVIWFQTAGLSLKQIIIVADTD